MNHIVKVAGVRLHWSLLFFLGHLLLISCDSDMSDAAKQTIYQGPLRTLENAEIVHSDSGKIKARVFASKILNYQNEDREVPDGLFITFYEKDGAKSATLKADYAYYTSEDRIWQARGNVIIHNIQNQETLRTEELFWNPQTGDVNTEKFVKIETPEELITGTGLTAKQDFSTWSIKHPEGIFVIEDEDGAENP